MKTKFPPLALLLSFTFAFSCAQKNEKPEITSHTPRVKIDSVFTDVIEITDRNIETNGTDYLFTIPISKKIEKPVVFISDKVPVHLLPSIYPEFKKLTVIVPNWVFYDQASDNSAEGGYCAEPIASSIIYEFDRTSGKLQKDSLVMMGGFPEMEFGKPYQLKNKELAIYYQEYFGSVCCPRDPQMDNTPTREAFISMFEKQHHTKITNTYSQLRGREGEVSFYYTLEGLSNQLKLRFIVDRNFYRIVNRHSKEISKQPTIYTPTVLEVNERIKKVM